MLTELDNHELIELESCFNVLKEQGMVVANGLIPQRAKNLNAFLEWIKFEFTKEENDGDVIFRIK